MAPSIVALLLIKVRQRLIEPEIVLELLRQKLHSPGKLPAVVIDLHHLLDAFDLQHLAVAQPVGRKDLVGRPVRPHHAKLLGSSAHLRAL